VSTAVLAVVVFAVVAYSAPGLRFKERPLLDSVTSSSHFVGPAAFGFAMTGHALDPATAAAFAAFFCWGVAAQAFGAVQDIEADNGAGIGSVATWLGAARTVRLAAAAYTAAGLLLLSAEPWPARLAGLLAAPYVVLVWPYRSLPDGECTRAHVGWRRFLALNYVTGFLLTQLLIWTAMGAAR
jgi:4-hydroxybenzoate polyprenyltransferase